MKCKYSVDGEGVVAATAAPAPAPAPVHAAGAPGQPITDPLAGTIRTSKGWLCPNLEYGLLLIFHAETD